MTGALEGAHYTKHREFYDFSEQQLIDCATHSKYGSYGCDGGFPATAYTFYWEHKAIPELWYKYVSGNGESSECKKGTQ